jgi:hypothetical protein
MRKDKEFSRDLAVYEKQMNSLQFYMYRYKTAWCPEITTKHDWAQCIYAHRLQDFRRPPDRFDYDGNDCPFLKNKGESWENCPKGLECDKCHSTFERLYHPCKYKLVYCEKRLCKRNKMCAFYHSVDEREEACEFSHEFVDFIEEE